MRRKQITFQRGVDARFPIEEGKDPSRLYRLQNTRLQKRGELGWASRIEGFESMVNKANYSNALDLAYFKDRVIVFYHDGAGTFSIDVVNPDTDSVVTTLSYSDSTTSEGELIFYEDSLFIAPHNKILYYDETGATASDKWNLNNFKSDIPIIDSLTGTSGGSKALGTFEVTSGADSGPSATPATGRFVVTGNDIPRNESITDLRVEVDGNQTSDITVNGGESISDIVDKIKTAIDNTSAISNDWDTSFLFESGRKVGVELESVNTGTSWNGRNFTVINSTEMFGDPSIKTGDDSSLNSGDVSGVRIGVVHMLAPDSSGARDGLTSWGRTDIALVTEEGTITTSTAPIATGESESSIAGKINTALNRQQVTQRYNITRDPDGDGNNSKFNIEAVDVGFDSNAKIYTWVVNFSFQATQIFDFSLSSATTDGETFNISGGQDGAGSLEYNTDYWYKVRYKYLDGHITKTSPAGHVNTGKNRSISVSIDTPQADVDLDGNRPIIQLFRRKKGDKFFLIEEIDDSASSDTISFTDAGESINKTLEEPTYVWNNSHEAHDIVENRYVRANVSYPDRDYTLGSGFSLQKTSTSENEILPKNTEYRVYTKPVYNDGVSGYHKSIGKVDVGDETSKLQIRQDATVSPNDGTIRELGLYAKPTPTNKVYKYPFNTHEIANQNIQTIGSSNEDIPVFPNNTRILFGFKYLQRLVEDRGGTNRRHFVFDRDWYSGGDPESIENTKFVIDYGSQSVPADPDADLDNMMPGTITQNIFGVSFQYVRISYSRKTDDDGVDHHQCIYKLANSKAIKEAAATGQLKVRLKNAIGQISSKNSTEDFFDIEVPVTGVIDRAEGQRESNLYSIQETERDKRSYLYPPLDSKLYFQLDESILDTVDQSSLNKYKFSQDYEDDTNGIEGGYNEGFNIAEHSLEFEILDLRRTQDVSFQSYTERDSGYDNGRPVDDPVVDNPLKSSSDDYYVYDWDLEQFYLYDFFQQDFEEGLIYIGKTDNSTDSSFQTVSLTGFELSSDVTNSVSFTTLAEYNIYEQEILLDDIRKIKDTFRNQLIWSEPIVRESFSSGGRTFSVENFLSLPTDNGDIVGIESTGRKLFVFCEEGVAVVNVGEALTQQKSGEVFVDSSTFLTDYYWVAESLNDVRLRSIQKFSNTIFFSDNYNVYTVSEEGLQTISEGAVSLDGSDVVGAIDPLNSEYRITETGQGDTWAYNFSSGEWMGPYKYEDLVGQHNQKDLYGVNGSDLVRHNTGDTFGGTSYTSEVVSIANDQEDPFVSKLFRRFFVQMQMNTNNTNKLEYSNDGANYRPIDLNTAKQVGGFRRVGINKAEQNSEQLYWKIVSDSPNFALRGLSFEFQPRRRRR